MDRHEWTDQPTGQHFVCTSAGIEAEPEPPALTVEFMAAPLREILRLAEELEKQKSLLVDELTRGQEELRRIREASEQGHRELVAQLGAALGIEEPAAVLEPVFAVEPFATSMGGALLWAAFQLRQDRDRLAEEVERLRGVAVIDRIVPGRAEP